MKRDETEKLMTEWISFIWGKKWMMVMIATTIWFGFLILQGDYVVAAILSVPILMIYFELLPAENRRNKTLGRK